MRGFVGQRVRGLQGPWVAGSVGCRVCGPARAMELLQNQSARTRTSCSAGSSSPRPCSPQQEKHPSPALARLEWGCGAARGHQRGCDCSLLRSPAAPECFLRSAGSGKWVTRVRWLHEPATNPALLGPTWAFASGAGAGSHTLSPTAPSEPLSQAGGCSSGLEQISWRPRGTCWDREIDDSFSGGGPGWQPVTSFPYCMVGTTVETSSGQGLPVSPCLSPLISPGKRDGGGSLKAGPP